MAGKRKQTESFEETKRISPYRQVGEAYTDANQEMDEQAYENAYEPLDDYDDVDSDEYNEEYDEEHEWDEEDQHEGKGITAFLTTKTGKLLVGVIAALVLVLLMLLGIFLVSRFKAKPLPQADNTPTPFVQIITPEPTTFVFAPVVDTQETPTPTPETIIFTPVMDEKEPESNGDNIEDEFVFDPEPTEEPTPDPEPEATSTPLPIILTNTPTPSPSPTPTAEPTPTLVPTSTPKPTPGPDDVLVTGKVNRDANLRQSASSSAKIKKTVKRGERVTIQETQVDKNGKLWYNLTVDDQALTGWMRDYVVDLDVEQEKATPTPKPTNTPKATGTPKPIDLSALDADTMESAEETPIAEAEPAEEAIASGKTNREANLRKVMNGKTLSTVKQGKAVSIYEVLKDRNGNTWYRLSVDGTNKQGYMRDYVIDLDGGVKLEAQSETETGTPTAAGQEVVGTARTNRAANVRKTPESGGKVVRQLSKGVKLNILGKYLDTNAQIWYMVSTESGNTNGFMRDYVLDIVTIDKDIEAQTYSE